MNQDRLSKRQKRLSEKAKKKIPAIQKQHFDIKYIEPITDNQEKAFQDYYNDKHLMLLGCPGTGKTFISMYLALREIMDGFSECTKVVIIRSAQPVKNQGFLPGDLKEKSEVYELPYKGLSVDLFGRGDVYEILKQKEIVNFTTTSFLRGENIDRAIVIVDEVQNMSYQEIKTVCTRLGEHSRLIICGDTKQDDLTSKRYNEESGINTLIDVANEMGEFAITNFGPEDIVRSGFVKAFIEAEYKLGLI